ncbi:MAG: transcriptional regulator with XRE-family HTH domain [Flavobacteriaceae bacterium]|jgi:transcriptional regulator with XRE-family HTH domain
MDSLSIAIKSKRKALKLRSLDLAQVLRIDQALISKYENGKRIPTKDQIKPLAKTLEIDYDELMVLYYKDLLLKYLSYDDVSLQALNLVKAELEAVVKPRSKSSSRTLKSLFSKLDKLHARFLKLDAEERQHLIDYSMLRFVHANCQLNENSLRQLEMRQVKEQGNTIAGKSIKEHLEVLNHFEGLNQCLNSTKPATIDIEYLLSIHTQTFKGIQGQEAGQLINAGLDLTKQLTALLKQFHDDINKIHPLIAAVDLSMSLSALSPFKKANQAWSNMVLNYILLQQGYLCMDIRSQVENPANYIEFLKHYPSKDQLNIVHEYYTESFLLAYQKAFNS